MIAIIWIPFLYFTITKKKIPLIFSNPGREDLDKRLKSLVPKILFLVFLTICVILLVLNSVQGQDITNHSIRTDTKQDPILYLHPDEYIYEMLRGNSQIFSVRGHSKSYGVDWQLKIPESWVIYDGEEQNIIAKFSTNDLKSIVAIAIRANKIPVPDGRIITNEEISDLFNDPKILSDIIDQKGKFISGSKMMIDEIPFQVSEFETKLKTNEGDIKMRAINFSFVVDNVLFNLFCSISSPQVDLDLSHVMDRYNRFFKLIARSIKINKNKSQNIQLFDIKIPPGFRKPNKNDMTEETDWFKFKEDFETPYYAHGDYNGDGIQDQAWQLINIKTDKVFQFCFLSAENGYKTILLDDNEDNKGYRVIQTMPKGSLICNEEIFRPLKFDGIGGAVYEVSDPWVYEYDAHSDTFSIYWDCPNGPSD